MLSEKGRLIKPENIKNQVEWDKVEAVVVLTLGAKGMRNGLHMSTLTVEELSLLTAQLQAHLAFILGPMNER